MNATIARREKQHRKYPHEQTLSLITQYGWAYVTTFAEVNALYAFTLKNTGMRIQQKWISKYKRYEVTLRAHGG